MKVKAIISVVACLVFILIGWQGIRLWMDEDTIEAEDVRSKLESQYNGKISSMKQTDDGYLMVLTRETGDYEFEVSEEGGRIIRMARIDSSSPEKSEQQELMTEDEARDVALERVSGSIDDIDYESSVTGSYFLVEIERENGKETTVQVNAITGEIMSVSDD
ncbi:PepSY domain-containing protein [Alkalihalobacillus sp. R86527]|uniref:PepSY domain-containing protein n=1 Tax=Alkalihalobacillus sp. R86527 TaxID=3093863 RepID=UPI00366BD818